MKRPREICFAMAEPLRPALAMTHRDTTIMVIAISLVTGAILWISLAALDEPRSS